MHTKHLDCGSLKGLAQNLVVLSSSPPESVKPRYSLMWLPEEFTFAHLATSEEGFGVPLVNLQGCLPICQSSGRTFQFQVGEGEIEEHQQLGSVDLTLLCLTGRAATKDGQHLRQAGEKGSRAQRIC